MAEPVAQYDDLSLGTTDASVIARGAVGVPEIATLDRRHSTAVWPRYVEAFTVLPERSEAE